MKHILPLLAVAVYIFSGCGTDLPSKAAPVEAHTSTIFAMDTVIELRICGDKDLLDQAEELIRNLEAKLSVTEEGSEIFAVNQDGCGDVSTETAELSAPVIKCKKTPGKKCNFMAERRKKR